MGKTHQQGLRELYPAGLEACSQCMRSSLSAGEMEVSGLGKTQMTGEGGRMFMTGLWWTCQFDAAITFTCSVALLGLSGPDGDLIAQGPRGRRSVLEAVVLGQLCDFVVLDLGHLRLNVLGVLNIGVRKIRLGERAA